MDTAMGGDQRAFPDTSWSLVLELGSATDRAAALERLCGCYWKPVYCFVRRAWRKPNEESKDLTQAFFAWLLQGDVLQKFDPGQGGFRHFLKGVLRNFVRNQEVHGRALKRGGGVVPLSIGALDGLEESLASREESPEAAFDRVWVTELVDRAVEAVRRTSLEAGDDVGFRVFEAYELSGAGSRPTYASVAASCGLSEAQVSKHLFRVRERIRAEMRRELRETVANPAQLEAEWSALFEAG